NKHFFYKFHIVKNLKVVNNTAEWGIKLITDYGKIIIKDEKKKQFLLNVVSDYRKQFPDAKKETFETIAVVRKFILQLS
ncbi:hypothetical protein ALC56_03872, partial [Trachymyrmex septentrionalis]